jgi:hypothetical protein
MSIDGATQTVTLDGKEYSISHVRAFQTFNAIAKADGQVIASEQIRVKATGLYGPVGRVLKQHLPAPLYELIQSTRGHHGGFSFRIPTKATKSHRKASKGH